MTLVVQGQGQISRSLDFWPFLSLIFLLFPDPVQIMYTISNQLTTQDLKEDLIFHMIPNIGVSMVTAMKNKVVRYDKS